MENLQNWQNKFIACQYSTRLIDKLIDLNTTAHTKVDITEVTKAIYYAKKYHAEQKRQSGEPYYSHPLEVAYMLAEYTIEHTTMYYRTDLTVTAILHDCIEDTLLTKNMIATIFGENVADQVEGLTRIKIDRKITAAESLDLLFSQNKKDVLLVKLFDRLHNLSTIGVKAPEKVKKIVQETLLYFVPLAMYLKTDIIKHKLIKLAYKSLAITTPYELNFVDQVYSSASYLQPCPTFQNVISQIKNRDLLEA